MANLLRESHVGGSVALRTSLDRIPRVTPVALSVSEGTRSNPC